MSRHTRRRTVASWAALAAGLCLPAQMAAAQTEPQTAAAVPANDEIIVTAQKRDERLIDVPASVSALRSEALINRGALRFEDYKAFIPGVSTITQAPGYNQINIRGINTGSNQLSSTVGTYFNESPTNSSTSAAIGNRLTPDPDLLDVARIEVLRGPQGTLYGANALGGVIKYVLVQPALDAMQGQAQAGISSVEHGGIGYVARAAIGAPIINDVLGFRASAFYTRDPGFVDNVATGRKDVDRSTNWGGRLALLWKPSDSFSVDVSSLYQKRDTEGFPQETVSATTSRPTEGRYKQFIPTDNFIKTEYQLHALTMNGDLGFAKLTSVTSYGRQKVDLVFDDSANLGTLLGTIGIPDVPYVSLPVMNDVRKFTQEVRLSSPAHSRIEYIVGAYYTHERSTSFNGGTGILADGTPAPAPTNPLQAVDLRNRYEEGALFANTTARLTNRFSIQLGGRWSRNWQKSTEPLEGLLFGPLAGTVIKQRSKESAWTFAVSPQYRISDDWNVYARVAKGFRPGGANLVLPGGGGNPTYSSDTLINYEVGTKLSALDRHLNLSLAAFWIDWRDIQTTAKDAMGFNYLLNGGKARSKGIEAEANWHAGGLTLGANLTYDHAKLKDAIPAVGALAGDRLPYTPSWAGAATADYEFATDGALVPSIGASVRHTGAQQAFYSQATPTNPADVKLPAYTFVDLRAGLRYDRWRLSVFVQNVADKRAVLSLDTQFVNPLTGDGARAAIARPRTIGATLDAKF